MRRTSVTDLVVPFLVLGVAAYVLLRNSYDSLPPLQWAIGLPLAGLAAAEVAAAQRVRGAVRHDPTAKPMAAVVVARLVALGKASALVAAAVMGIAVALFIRVVPDAARVRAARNDLWVSIVLVVAGALLLLAGLYLERAGIDPGQREPGSPG